jgi:polyketide biosynthesis enoyl-CoA hydratase PksI
MSDVLHVTRPEAGICELHMDDAANRNGLGEALVRGLMTAFASLATDSSVKVVLLKGRADVFCAGATLESLRDVAHDRVRVKDVELPATVVGCPVPVVAAIEGHAVGGGLALALCCDIQVAAEESRYGTNFAELGFTPGMGTTTLLPLAVGHGRASEMMMTARFYKGREMAGTGLFTHVVPRADVAALALDIARNIARKDRVVIELLKDTLGAPKRAGLQQAISREHLMHQICFQRPETLRAIEENYLGDSGRPERER